MTPDVVLFANLRRALRCAQLRNMQCPLGDVTHVRSAPRGASRTLGKLTGGKPVIRVGAFPHWVVALPTALEQPRVAECGNTISKSCTHVLPRAIALVLFPNRYLLLPLSFPMSNLNFGMTWGDLRCTSESKNIFFSTHTLRPATTILPRQAVVDTTVCFTTSLSFQLRVTPNTRYWTHSYPSSRVAIPPTPVYFRIFIPPALLVATLSLPCPRKQRKKHFCIAPYKRGCVGVHPPPTDKPPLYGPVVSFPHQRVTHIACPCVSLIPPKIRSWHSHTSYIFRFWIYIVHGQSLTSIIQRRRRPSLLSQFLVSASSENQKKSVRLRPFIGVNCLFEAGSLQRTKFPSSGLFQSSLSIPGIISCFVDVEKHYRSGHVYRRHSSLHFLGSVNLNSTCNEYDRRGTTGN